jgi:hypothetical protein
MLCLQPGPSTVWDLLLLSKAATCVVVWQATAQASWLGWGLGLGWVVAEQPPAHLGPWQDASCVSLWFPSWLRAQGSCPSAQCLA